MKTLKESILDNDFDIQEPSEATMELLKLLDSFQWFTIGGKNLTTEKRGRELMMKLDDILYKYDFLSKGKGEGEPEAFVYYKEDRGAELIQIIENKKNSNVWWASFHTFQSSPRFQFNMYQNQNMPPGWRGIKCTGAIYDPTLMYWLRQFFDEKMKKSKSYEDS